MSVRLITYSQVFKDSLQRILYWTKSNGDLYSYYQNGNVEVFQNGNKLVEDIHYTVTQDLNAFDFVEINEDTHFDGATYQIQAIKTI